MCEPAVHDDDKILLRQIIGIFYQRSPVPEFLAETEILKCLPKKMSGLTFARRLSRLRIPVEFFTDGGPMWIPCRYRCDVQASLERLVPCPPQRARSRKASRLSDSPDKSAKAGG